MTHGLLGHNLLHWPVDYANSGCGECGIKVRLCPSEARRLLYSNTFGVADWPHLLGYRS